jgi:hypothetical protein
MKTMEDWSDKAPTEPGDYWFAYKFSDRAGTVEYRKVEKDWLGNLCVNSKYEAVFWGPDPTITAMFDAGWWKKAILPDFPIALLD